MGQAIATPAEATGQATARRRRLLSRFLAASVVATAISQVVFVTSYWATGLSVLATVLGWLGGAIPNFLLNRRSWGGGERGLRSEIFRYGMISVATALLAGLATETAETFAAATFPDARPARVAIVWGAFLGTYVVMFAVKFVLTDRLVFSARRPPRQAR